MNTEIIKKLKEGFCETEFDKKSGYWAVIVDGDYVWEDEWTEEEVRYWEHIYGDLDYAMRMVAINNIEEEEEEERKDEDALNDFLFTHIVETTDDFVKKAKEYLIERHKDEKENFGYEKTLAEFFCKYYPMVRDFKSHSYPSMSKAVEEYIGIMESDGAGTGVDSDYWKEWSEYILGEISNGNFTYDLSEGDWTIYANGKEIYYSDYWEEDEIKANIERYGSLKEAFRQTTVANITDLIENNEYEWWTA